MFLSNKRIHWMHQFPMCGPSNTTYVLQNTIKWVTSPYSFVNPLQSLINGVARIKCCADRLGDCWGSQIFIGLHPSSNSFLKWNRSIFLTLSQTYGWRPWHWHGTSAGCSYFIGKNNHRNVSNSLGIIFGQTSINNRQRPNW